MLSARLLFALCAALVIADPASALAQGVPASPPMPPARPHEMIHRHEGMMPMAAQPAAGTLPALPGQDAFGAIQEIVAMLDADPKTDWSKVDLEALRQHLIDMNEVTLRADAAPKTIDGGLQIAVTGNDRTLVAIQRMVPAWAHTMEDYKGWSTPAAPLPNGELLTVTSTDTNETRHIRGLGFIGLLVSGSHHQMHHLMMAKGEMHTH